MIFRLLVILPLTYGCPLLKKIHCTLWFKSIFLIWRLVFKQPLDLCQGIQDLICADKRINQEPNELISDSILKGKQASRTRCADILRQSLEPEL